VNFFRPKIVLESDIPNGAADQSTRDFYPREPTESFRSRRKKRVRESAADRQERDTQRGYSINVKQVVLAFAADRQLPTSFGRTIYRKTKVANEFHGTSLATCAGARLQR
jgi:hypothetical protein